MIIAIVNLKSLITTVADNIFIFFYREIRFDISLADDLHEITSFTCSRKNNLKTFMDELKPSTRTEQTYVFTTMEAEGGG